MTYFMDVNEKYEYKKLDDRIYLWVIHESHPHKGEQPHVHILDLSNMNLNDLQVEKDFNIYFKMLKDKDVSSGYPHYGEEQSVINSKLSKINEKITSYEIEDILGLHEKWLNNEPDGKRADFSGKDLSGIDLSGIDLSGAAFYGTNLTGANLKGTILENAGLDATLDGADLSGADLRGAVLPENMPDNVKLDNVIWQDEPEVGQYETEIKVSNEEIDLPDLPLGDNEPRI